jgi:large subunit ribosomal protein L10
MLTRVQKEEQVAFLKQRVDRATSALAMDYRGLTVAQLTELRRKLRELGEGQTDYRVAKNTLLRRAINGTRFEGLGRYLEGPTAVAFAFEDASSVARVLVDYAKDNEKLGLKGGVVEGEVLDAKGIEALSKLPSKLELRGMLAGTLQAPLRNVAGTLYALLGHVRNALEQRQQKLEAQ